MRSFSRQPRRQRRALYTADNFERRRRMSLPLSRELRGRYGRRSLPVRKGDTVRVLSGSYVGREERVAKVNRRDYSVTLDNATVKKADAKLKPLPMRPSHLLLTKLNLADPWRRRMLKVTGEEEAAEAAEPAPPSPPAPEPPKEATPSPAAPKRRKAPASRKEAKP